MSQHSGVKTEGTFVMETKIDMLVVASLGAIILYPLMFLKSLQFMEDLQMSGLN